MSPKPKHKVGHSFPAVPIVQNEQRFYFTTIPVSALFESCFVVSRDENSSEGFQRKLNRTRAEDIAKYLSNGKGSIPTNIVLSAQEDSDTTYNSRSKLIAYPGKTGSFLVLDGQHRLWGYQLCYEQHNIDHRVPVAIYTGLNRVEEAKLFIDINTTQVGVPSALLLDIKQVAQLENSKEQILRALFDNLNEDKKSPLKKLLSPSRSLTGKVSRVTFNKALLPVIRSGIWADASEKSRLQLLINYISAVAQIVDDSSILVRSAFFESIFEVFDDVVQTSIAKHGNAKKDSLHDILKPISAIDFQELLSRGRTSKTTYLEPIKSALKKSISISDSMV